MAVRLYVNSHMQYYKYELRHMQAIWKKLAYFPIYLSER